MLWILYVQQERGLFLDRQAERLGIEISEFGNLALKSENPVRIAGRCAVFAETDMIHKQQLGHKQSDIAKGGFVKP